MVVFATTFSAKFLEKAYKKSNRNDKKIKRKTFVRFLTVCVKLHDDMSEKDIARQVLRGYIDREIDLENQLKEILRRHKMTGAATAEEDAGDFFKIRREQLEKRKKIAKKRNETFLKDLEHTTAKLRASLACDDLTDKRLDIERKKFIDYIRREQSTHSINEHNTIHDCF